MDDLRVRLFSEPSVQHNGQPVRFPSGKSLELFCYLLIHRGRLHTREALAEVLWPGGRPDTSKRYLRQALWRLNSAVHWRCDCHLAGNELILVIDPCWVRINPDADFWLDVSSFERAYDATRDTAGHQLSDQQAKDMENALELYRGDLLANWYYDWCGHERDRLQLVYLAMLDQLIGYCEARQLYAKGLDLGQEVLRHDPAREYTHRQLMRLRYRSGDRTSALRQYERCSSVIAQEFGIQPSADTVALYEQIRADRVPDVPPLPGPPLVPQSVPEQQDDGVVADLRLQLDQILASLRTLQDSVQGKGSSEDGH